MAESHTINTALADALTLDHVQALRAETHQRQEIWALLGLLEGEVFQAIKVADPTEPRLLAWRLRRVRTMLDEEIVPLVRRRYALIAAQTIDFLVRLAQVSARALRRIVGEVTGDDHLAEAVPLAVLRTQVTEGLFPSGTRPTDLSGTTATWWQRLRDSLVLRLGNQTLVSVSLDEPLNDLLARVRGTAALGYTDGLMGKAKEDAARLLRTAVTHAVNRAREAVAGANPESGMVLCHHSILDGHTCLGPETLLRTPIGLQKIALLGVNDMVYGGSGHLRTILAIHANQATRLARVTFSDGTTIVCTPDHEFFTQDAGWVQAQELKENTILRTESML